MYTEKSPNLAASVDRKDERNRLTVGRDRGLLFNDYSRAVITNNLRPAGSTEPLGRFFGEYSGAFNPRIIQLGIKLYF